MPLLWCSFADPDKPKGKQFLGVVITEAADVDEASSKFWKLRINPGGEILASKLPEDSMEAKFPLDKLLSEDDLRRLSGKEPEKLQDNPELLKQVQGLKCGSPGHGRLN